MDKDFIELQRLTRFKQSPRKITATKLGEDIVTLYKQQLEKSHKKFGKLSDVWFTFCPDDLQMRTDLASFVRGTLTVLVDGSSYLYQLKQLLLAGLEQQIIQAAVGTGLKKISLKPGKKKM